MRPIPISARRLHRDAERLETPGRAALGSLLAVVRRVLPWGCLWTVLTMPLAHAEMIAVRVTLTDGQTLQGLGDADLIESWTPGSALVLQVDGQPIRLPAEVLAQVDGDAAWVDPEGAFQFANPARSRYFYAPSALPLQKGEGYISQKELLFTSAAVGLTDHVAVLGGTVVPALLFAAIEGEADALVGVLGAKVGARIRDAVWVGAGGEAFLFAGEVIGLGFVNATYGNHNTHLTVASGFIGFSGEDGLLVPVTVAATHRTHDNFAWLTENWLVFDTDPALVFGAVSVGGRFISSGAGGRRFTIDPGLIMTVADGEVSSLPIPWIDFAWHFHTTR